MLTQYNALAKAKAYATDGDFNVRSPQQVAKLLFETLGLKPPKGNPYSAKKMKTDQKSVSVEVLLLLSSQHPVPALIMDYRKLQKLKSTYIVPLCKFAVNDDTPAAPSSTHFLAGNTGPPPSRIHPHWVQTGTRTGRLSCRKVRIRTLLRAMKYVRSSRPPAVMHLLSPALRPSHTAEHPDHPVQGRVRRGFPSRRLRGGARVHLL